MGEVEEDAAFFLEIRKSENRNQENRSLSAEAKEVIECAASGHVIWLPSQKEAQTLKLISFLCLVSLLWFIIFSGYLGAQVWHLYENHILASQLNVCFTLFCMHLSRRLCQVQRHMIRNTLSFFQSN